MTIYTVRVITEVNEIEGTKNGITESDPSLMHRAVAFCPNIKASKKVTEIFNVHKDAYYESLSKEDREKTVTVESDHIDGSMGAATRDEKLAWLKNTPTDGKDCRILTNVRCLSEGVDVPSLDKLSCITIKLVLKASSTPKNILFTDCGGIMVFGNISEELAVRLIIEANEIIEEFLNNETSI